ncbi:MAG: L-threonylcarbamoyladenylate synthase [Oscillospiraceae bacterium]|nr:L-threonylcarbamoyladenylate synthase [Oscillospiraceae bacterium]
MSIVNTLRLTAADVALAGQLLAGGQTVAIPTETVYGLAANALDEAAVRHIFEAKGRPADNPLIVHIADRAELIFLVTNIPPVAKKLTDAFWPGPLTLILPRAPRVPAVVSAGLPTVAVRFPSHPLAQQIIQAAGVPLAAPSANRSGSPSPTTAAHVLADLDGRIAAVVDGGPCAVGVESTVVDLTGGTPRLLRPGGVTPEQLRAVCGEVIIDPTVLAPLGDRAAPSPGLKHKHYAPATKTVLVEGSSAAYAEYVNTQSSAAALCFDSDVPSLKIPFVSYGDGDACAQRVFAALREADTLGAQCIYAHAPEKSGLMLAVYNRLLRAAEFEVIPLG